MSYIQQNNTEITLIPPPLRSMRAGLKDTPMRDAVLDIINEAINNNYTIAQRHTAITQRLSDLQECIVKAARTLSTDSSNSTLNIRLILLDASEARADIAQLASYMTVINERYNLVDENFLKTTTSKLEEIGQLIKDDIILKHDILDTNTFP